MANEVKPNIPQKTERNKRYSRRRDHYTKNTQTTESYGFITWLVLVFLGTFLFFTYVYFK